MTRVLSFEGNQSYPKLRKPVLPNRDVSTEAGSDMTCMGNYAGLFDTVLPHCLLTLNVYAYRMGCKFGYQSSQT